jgi:VCBS repeat-containing protein
VTVDVLSNDFDPDNDPLVVTAYTQGAKGSVGLDAEGTMTYTPGDRAKGQDRFTYTISDGLESAAATVYVSIKGSGGDGSGGDGGGNGNGNGRGKPK